jgi:hypothetical protein
MLRPASLLFLVLALAGQPLRQAEAASDFARVLAHLLEADGTVEIPDGGVGDDAWEAVLKAESGQASAPEWCRCVTDLWASAPGLPTPAILTPFSPGRFPPLGRHERVPWPPTRAGQRQAWLQLLQV